MPSSGMPETPVTRDWSGVWGWGTETVDALRWPSVAGGRLWVKSSRVSFLRIILATRRLS